MYQKSYTKKKFNYKKGKKNVTDARIARIARTVSNKAKPTREIRYTQDSDATPFDTNSVANAFRYITLANIVQGDADNQRTGDKIYMSGCKFNLSIDNPLTVPRACRVIILANDNKNGDLLDISTWTDLFTGVSEADSTAGNKAGDLTYPINANYKIYFDKVYTIPPNAEGRALRVTQSVPIRRMIYYDNLGAATTVSNGEVFMILHLAEPTGTLSATKSYLSCFVRCFYKDA